MLHKVQIILIEVCGIVILTANFFTRLAFLNGKLIVKYLHSLNQIPQNKILISYALDVTVLFCFKCLAHISHYKRDVILLLLYSDVGTNIPQGKMIFAFFTHFGHVHQQCSFRRA